ncbi:hypothetical protein [Anaerobiospirillum sp. NML120449]|uniref:hypothetical protein n=1 Tax=Anaerobiospirillum sp. NML120449 TaxID=2932817 RepID=UPI001FF6770E|nr:hypothetical protein [Anaerobiospirillum sp. NML120449]MCK0526793.1 hypothetical protein [Anaerobiospirillum sp. NML120449]
MTNKRSAPQLHFPHINYNQCKYCNHPLTVPGNPTTPCPTTPCPSTPLPDLAGAHHEFSWLLMPGRPTLWLILITRPGCSGLTWLNM